MNSSWSARYTRITPVPLRCAKPATEAGPAWALMRIDCYLLHWRGSVALEEAVSGFEALRSRGSIRFWGVSNFDVVDMQELLSVEGGNACAVNQVYLSLTQRNPQYSLLPWLQAKGMVTMPYSPLDQGALGSQPTLAFDCRSVARHTVAGRACLADGAAASDGHREGFPSRPPGRKRCSDEAQPDGGRPRRHRPRVRTAQQQAALGNAVSTGPPSRPTAAIETRLRRSCAASCCEADRCRLPEDARWHECRCAGADRRARGRSGLPCRAA